MRMTPDEAGEKTLAATGLADPGSGDILRGTLIGRYVVLSRLGAGGMGIVYAAYDPELDRKVALKLLHPEISCGHEDRSKRLVREAQALAKLSHPNVVAVFDVGELDGGVWIAMEFIDGQTLGAWLKQTHRRWSVVLKVLLEVGSGVSAAHSVGLIHRDLKPENIMIGTDGRVRVMDFGLARRRATDEAELVAADTLAQDSRAHPALAALALRMTQAGAVIGTPAYMALEQFRGQELDTTADQFSFCAIAWEALYGARAFTGKTLIELVACLMSGKPSPPARTKVPAWIRRALERGLSPEPKGRWPSMDVLLQRLSQDPRSALRWRLLVGSAVLVVGAAALVQYGAREAASETVARRRATCEAAGALLGEAWDDTRRSAAGKALLATGLPFAADTWDRARARLDSSAQAWRDASVETCLAAYVHGTLTPKTFERRMACLKRQRAELDGLSYALAMADAAVAERAVQATVTLPRPEECADQDARQDDESDDSSRRGEIEVLRQKLARSRATEAAGRYVDAMDEARRVVQAARVLGQRGLVAEGLQRVASCQQQSGDYKAAEASLNEGYFLADAAGRDVLRAEIATTLASVVGTRLTRVEDGLVWLSHAEAIEDRLGLGAQARASLITAKSGLRRVQGNLDEAGILATESLSMFERLYGPDDVRVARMQLNVGTHLFDRGDYAGAERLYRLTLKTFEQTLGPTHPDLAAALNNLATARERLGQSAGAEEAYARAMAIRVAAFGERHPGVGVSLTNLGELYSRHGDPTRAETSFRRAAQIFEAVLGPDHPNVASALGGLGRALVAQGRFAEARPLFIRAQKILEHALGLDNALVAFPNVDLANLALAANEPVAAIAPASRALSLRADRKSEERAEAALVLSRALWRSASDRPRARMLATQAEADYAAAGPGFVKEHAEAVAWRRNLGAP